MRWAFFLVFILGVSNSMASLSYEVNQVDVHASVRDAQVAAQFLFANTGKTSVGIKSIKTSCGCTTATSDKLIYAPGEKGAINVVYKIQEKPGLNKKEILVETDDKSDPVHQLILRAFIPDAVLIDPTSLRWELGEALKPKSVKIHVTDPGSLSISRVCSANPSFTTTLKTITPKSEYEMFVLPKDTTQPKAAMLLIQTSLTGARKFITTDATVELAR